MGYLPVVIGIEDSTGARADAKRADGTRSAIILRFDGLFTTGYEFDGGTTRVTIGSAIAALDGAGVLTIGAGATSIVIGGAGIPVSVPGDFSVGGDVTITGDLTVDGTTTSIHSTVLDVADRVIHVNHSGGDDDPVPTDIAGLAVHRGAIAGVDRDHAGWVWDEANSMWRAAWNTGGDDATIGADLAVRTGTLSVTTGGDVAPAGLVRLPDVASITAWGTGPATIDMLTKDATDTVYVGGTQVGNRPNALEYSSTTGHWFRTGVTSKLIIEPSYVRLGVPLRWDNTVASPVFYQADLANGTGQTMLWHAQDAIIGIGGDLYIRPGSGSGAHGQLALQDGAGDGRVIVDAVGKLSLFSATTLELGVGADALFNVSTSQVLQTPVNFRFGWTVASPHIEHQSQSTGGATGDQFEINAQNETGVDVATGGALLAHGGDATNGGAYANIGGAATFRGGNAAGSGASVGGDAIVQAGDGVTDGQVLLKSGDGTARFTIDSTDNVGVVAASSFLVNAGGYRAEFTTTELRLDADVVFVSSMLAPVIAQETHATTPQTMLFHSMDVTTGTGSDLDMRPGSGSVAHGKLAMQDGGGADRVTVSAGGAVEIDSNGSMTIRRSGGLSVEITSTTVNFSTPTLAFPRTVVTPLFHQVAQTTGNGQLFTVAAQAADEGADVTAGALLLSGGDATDGGAWSSIGGSATLKGGDTAGVNVSVGGDAIVQPGAGVTDGAVYINDGDGDPRVIVDADGNVTIDVAATVSLDIGGSSKVLLTASALYVPLTQIGESEFRWASNVTAPLFYQRTHATTPQTMLFHSMDVTTGTGSDLQIRPGAGSVAHGSLALLDGEDNDRVVVGPGGDVTITPSANLYVSVGGTRLTVTSSEVLAAVPVGVPSYNVAGAPAAAGMDGRLIYVTDGDSGSACLACGDGTNWKVISLGATIST